MRPGSPLALVVFFVGAIARGAGDEARTPADTAQLSTLLDARMPHRAEELLRQARHVPPALAEEIRIRSALARGARTEADRLLGRAADTAVSRLARAAIALDRGASGQGVKHCERGLALLGQGGGRLLFELRLVHASALIQQNRFVEALQGLLALPRSEAAIPWSPYQLLLSCVDAGDDDRPRLVRKALETDPTNPDSWAAALQVALGKGSYGEVERCFLNQARLWRKRTLRPPFRGLGPVGTAPYRTQVALAGKPVSVATLWAEIGWIAISRDRSAQARVCLQQALLHCTRVPEELWLIGRLQATLGDGRAAVASLEPAISHHPEAARYLAAAWVRLGRPDRGLAVLEAAPPEERARPRTALARVRALVEAGRILEARNGLSALAPVLALDPEFWLTGAEVDRRSGDRAAAVRRLRQIMVLARLGRLKSDARLKAARMAQNLGAADVATRLTRAAPTWDRAGLRIAGSGYLSSLAFRLLADRACASGDSAVGLELLDQGEAKVIETVLERVRVEPDEVDDSLRGALLLAAKDQVNPLRLARARSLLTMGQAGRAIEALRPILQGEDKPSIGTFLLAAGAHGQLGARDRMNALMDAASALAARPGAPWGACTQLALLASSDEALHWLARTARSFPEPQDITVDVAVLAGLGGCYSDCLQMAIPPGSPGGELGMGISLIAVGQRREGKLALERAGRSGAGAWQRLALLARAGIAAEEQDLSLAQRLLGEAVALGAADHRTDEVRARLMLQQGRLAEASRFAEEARKKGPGAAAPVQVAARIARAAGKPSLPLFKESCRLAPHVAGYWEALAREQAASGEDPREAWTEAARQALASGELELAARSLTSLSGRASKRAAAPGAEALVAAYRRLATREGLAPRMASDLAREGAALLVELDEPERALGLTGLASELARRTVAGSASTSDRSREVTPIEASVVFIFTLVILPALTSRRLSRGLEALSRQTRTDDPRTPPA
ncbi:MAG: hypothetical protein HY815_19750 [Candidatus Riflebacteria bacterium]|nr:hypothetical protein [Candidatus Riflebacteria bacterium]